MTQAAILAASGSPGTTTGFKNRIINGNMAIDQRNAGASVTLAGGTTITLDRWSCYSAEGSKYSIQQNAGSVTPPAGFTYYLGATSLAATTPGTEDVYLVRQYIEGYNAADLSWGTANAKTITMSFWVRSSLTGTFGGALKNASGDYSYPFTYTISAANTWEQKSITIAGSTAGTWNTTNGLGVSVVFSLGCGSGYTGTAGAWAAGNYFSATGSTNVVATSGATWYITGVQLEVGTTATNFDFRSITQETILCQRYFQTFKYNGVGMASNSNACVFQTALPVEMRAKPSTARTSGTITASDVAVSGYETTTSTVSTGNGGTTAVSMDIIGGWSPALATLRPLIFSSTGTPSSDASFLLSAEL